ncbi:beta-ig-h3 fasciclin [Paramyrothecium foliicola]|nr:beta-ig-h3 fasciclin [Paramyrothecium foliicola]
MNVGLEDRPAFASTAYSVKSGVGKIWPDPSPRDQGPLDDWVPRIWGEAVQNTTQQHRNTSFILNFLHPPQSTTTTTRRHASQLLLNSLNMRSSLWSYVLMAGSCLAQGDIAALLASQDDLSTLLELVSLVDGLADTLASASNITIFAPTNQAFANVPRNIPEGEAIELRNDSIAVGALLANHVFKGVYPSNVITDVPTFAQTLLDDSYITAVQPFSNFTGGAYNGLVKNGDDVCVLSGENTISTVTQAVRISLSTRAQSLQSTNMKIQDIKLGEGITIHKIDTVLSFGAPFQLFTFRGGYLAMNAALEAAHLPFAFGETGDGVQGLNISDYTIFVPTDEAFKSIGSVLAESELETLQDVLRYHIIPNNVIFSPSLGNVTVKSLQGDDLTFTVLPDGSAWVNNARITFPNTILYNGVAHVIDSVLVPGEFDRASLEPSAPASERLAFADATSVSNLPFSSVSFATDLMRYTTTPELLKTVAAVPTQEAAAPTTTPSEPSPIPTGAGNVLFPNALMALSAAVGIAAFLI